MLYARHELHLLSVLASCVRQIYNHIPPPPPTLLPLAGKC